MLKYSKQKEYPVNNENNTIWFFLMFECDWLLNRLIGTNIVHIIKVKL